MCVVVFSIVFRSVRHERGRGLREAAKVAGPHPRPMEVLPVAGDGGKSIHESIRAVILGIVSPRTCMMKVSLLIPFLPRFLS